MLCCHSKCLLVSICIRGQDGDSFTDTVQLYSLVLNRNVTLSDSFCLSFQHSCETLLLSTCSQMNDLTRCLQLSHKHMDICSNASGSSGSSWSSADIMISQVSKENLFITGTDSIIPHSYERIGSRLFRPERFPNFEQLFGTAVDIRIEDESELFLRTCHTLWQDVPAVTSEIDEIDEIRVTCK